MKLIDAILETQQLHVKMYSSLITNAYVCDDHGGKQHFILYNKIWLISYIIIIIISTVVLFLFFNRLILII